MKDIKSVIQRYEELLDKDYCNCNELNCIDNNTPRLILKIMKEQQRKIDEITKIINETELKTWDGKHCSVKDLQFVKWIEDIINENNI